MNRRKRYVALATLMLLPVSGLLGMQSATSISQQSNDVIADTLQAMQDCINFNELVTKNNPALQQVRQQSMFKQAINYIENIRSESKVNVERPDLAQLNEIAFEQNRSEELFSRLLDEVLAHYTILSETKGRFYGRVYKLSSVDGQDEPILGSHENEFRAVLQNGAKQARWGKSVIVNLPALQQDGSAVIRSLNLHELINALPAAGMSTATKVGLAVGGAAAIGAAVYGYNYLQQPGVSPELSSMKLLENKVNKVENSLESQSSNPTPLQIDVGSYEYAAKEFADHVQQLEQAAAANPDNKAVQEELAQAQGTLEKLQNGDFAALTGEDYKKIGLGFAGVAGGAVGGRRILQQRAATRAAEQAAIRKIENSQWLSAREEAKIIPPTRLSDIKPNQDSIGKGSWDAARQEAYQTDRLAAKAEQNAANKAQAIQEADQAALNRQNYVDTYPANNAAALEGNSATIESQGATFAQQGPWYERSIETNGFPKGRLEGKRIHSSNIPTVKNVDNTRSVDSQATFGYPKTKQNIQAPAINPQWENQFEYLQ